MVITVANVMTALRVTSVPFIVYFSIADRWGAALFLFIVACLSDGADGYIARRFDQRTDLGAILDPAADKLLLTTVFVLLAAAQKLPIWLVAVIIGRDVLIVTGVITAWMMKRPPPMKPLFISKVNTALQSTLAALVMAESIHLIVQPSLTTACINWVLAFTVASGTLYVRDWIRLTANAPPVGPGQVARDKTAGGNA